jgi:hypothetical protein
VSLTDTAPGALKLQYASYTVGDDRGLDLEALPSGSMIWRYRYSLDGKRGKLILAKHPALTLNSAPESGTKRRIRWRSASLGQRKDSRRK